LLLTLSDALRPLCDPERVQTVAMTPLAEKFGSSRAMFFHVDPDGDGMTLGAAYQGDATELPPRIRLSVLSDRQLDHVLMLRQW
jgi:GAF domain-containing protein